MNKVSTNRNMPPYVTEVTKLVINIESEFKSVPQSGATSALMLTLIETQIS